MRVRFVVLSLVLLAISPILFAQQHRETTTVEVVQVPVYVTASGDAVRDLTKENFELFVNGKMQPIDYFDVIDFAGLAKLPPEQRAQDIRQRRLYVLVFDLVYSDLKMLARAQQAAARYVESSAETDLFAIATYRANSGLQLAVPFTRDREILKHAIHSLRMSSVEDPLHLAISAAEKASLDSDTRKGEAGGGADNQGITYANTPRQAVLELNLDSQRELAGFEVDSLADLAPRLAPIEGLKHVVLMTGGFDSTLIHGVTLNTRGQGGIDQRPGHGYATPRPVFNGQVPSTNALAPELQHKLNHMYASYTASNVFLDTIDLAGVREPPFNWTPSKNESLFTLARDTGGTVVENRNDFVDALQHLNDLQRVVYVLGFHAHDTGRNENALKVRVINVPRGVNVTYRPSYAAKMPATSTRDGLRLADILTNDIPQTGVTMSVGVRSADANATLDVTISGKELIALSSDGKSVDGEALMYIYSGPGVVAFQQKKITIDVAQAREALGGSAVTLAQEFHLPPGQYAAKVLVRLEGSDAIGFARADFNMQ